MASLFFQSDSFTASNAAERTTGCIANRKINRKSSDNSFRQGNARLEFGHFIENRLNALGANFAIFAQVVKKVRIAATIRKVNP